MGAYVLLKVSDQSLDKSPFFDAAHKAGASQYIVLNHMFMPYGYGDVVEEYWSLVRDVTLWDVATERQVEVAGRDAPRFVDLIVARNLEKLSPGQCRYVVMTDETGAIINDPVIARLEANLYWISAADADILLWCKGVAAFAGLEVAIRQPDVAPIQIQGAKAREVVGALFGEPALKLRYYHLLRTDLRGIPVVLTRTGWSGDLGYEIYLCDTSRAQELWNLVLEAGGPYRMRVTGPNTIRRVEAGIIAMRSDIPPGATPYHVGLERLVDLSRPADYIGKAALRETARKGVNWSLASIAFDESVPHPESAPFGAQPVLWNGRIAGETTVVVHSPRLDRTIGYARIDSAAAALGTRILIDGKHGRAAATVVTRPFFDPGKTIPKA